MKVSAQNLHAFCVEALIQVGVSQADARTTADVLVTTDTWGTFTHGTKALRAYVRRLRGGGLRKNGRPKVVSEGPAWALVDGDSSLGMVSSEFAMQTALAKAAAVGIAFVGLRNNCHYGAAGYYASMAIEKDMIGISMANDIPTVNAPGARGSVLGSNPFGFAAPAGKEKPILLDMATSTVAGGKVFAAAALGKTIPGDWLLDANAKPTTDPTLFSHAGSLTPLGGYKGYGIAFLIEVLSAILTGAAIRWQVSSWTFSDPSKPTGHGAAFIALHIASFMPVEQFKERIDRAIREIHAAEKADGAGRIYLPGEMEWERREKALVEGIDLPEDVSASLRGLAEDLNLDLNRILR
ncbi:MAG: malate dehydrogenase [Verrucomicrobia bacterium]|nr:MAG: malate dehydrogenase [Verrucomicrobiota bacterium]PYM11540.1 MAG: malate dehydrogenase [Verrucomicrobiota bacterium]